MTYTQSSLDIDEIFFFQYVQIENVDIQSLEKILNDYINTLKVSGNWTGSLWGYQKYRIGVNSTNDIITINLFDSPIDDRQSFFLFEKVDRRLEYFGNISIFIDPITILRNINRIESFCQNIAVTITAGFGYSDDSGIHNVQEKKTSLYSFVEKESIFEFLQSNYQIVQENNGNFDYRIEFG